MWYIADTLSQSASVFEGLPASNDVFKGNQLGDLTKSNLSKRHPHFKHDIAGVEIITTIKDISHSGKVDIDINMDGLHMYPEMVKAFASYQTAKNI